MRRHLSIVLLVSLAFGVGAQSIDLGEVEADGEFRDGVVAFNYGELTNSVFALTRSLSFRPDDPLTRLWLGRAFYYTGYEEEALAEWRWVLENGGRSAFLQSRVTQLEQRRSLNTEGETPAREEFGGRVLPDRYITMETLTGVREELAIFRAPTMVRPRDDGSFYLVSFATHEVILMDVNGVRRRVIDGGLEGFDQPFDVAEMPDGTLFVSEFNADRIAIVDADGFKVGSFASGGRGEGELVGPQYLALDGNGYLYVCDYGNRRVVKFDTDGEYVLSFGAPGEAEVALREPAGVAYMDGSIFVADTLRGSIEVYDQSGNRLGSVSHPLISAPEALSVYDDGLLLVSDSNRLLIVDPERQAALQIGAVGANQQLVGAARDANGHIIAADFAGSELMFMAESVYLGLTAEIRWIDSGAFPRVLFSVAVKDAEGRPIHGLNEENFLVTEDRFPVGAETVRYGAHEDNHGAFVLIVERSRQMRGYAEAVRDAAVDFVDAVGSRPRWVIPAQTTPVVAADPSSGRLTTIDAAVGRPQEYGVWSLDRALRLAVSELYEQTGVRSIVYVGTGSGAENAFDTYGLVESAALLRNNDVSFSVVSPSQTAVSAELDYLVSESGGERIYLYQPRGSGTVVADALRRRPGTYVLEIRSVNQSDFGRAYIPLELRVDLIGRSGVDQSGYFAPLEF